MPNEEVVRRTLAIRDRGDLIRQAMVDSWDTFLEKYPERAWWRRKSTRAAVLWEHSVQNAISLLADDPGCKPVPHDDTFSFVFDQLVLVRLKKADIELKTKNYPTFLASLFHVHDATLPGFEDLHRVEAAYVLNQFQTGIDWIGIVARHEKRHLWHFDLEVPSKVQRLPVPERTETAAERVMRPRLPMAEPKSEDEKE